MNLHYLKACGGVYAARGLAVTSVRVKRGNFEATIINTEHIFL
jgi:hypothetical protein